jgi:hypothetical protein
MGTAGVNFTNVLPEAFTLLDRESVKITVKPSVFFTLSGSVCIKDVHRALMKLSPGVHWTFGLSLTSVAKLLSNYVIKLFL